MDDNQVKLSPSILHINVRGFHSKRAEILHYIDQLAPLVICLSELKQKSPPRIQGYYNYKPPFPNRPYQGGLAVYVHCSLDSALIDRTWDNNIEVVPVRISFPMRHINIVAAYFPPHDGAFPSPRDLDFISHLHGPTLLIGDLNAHHRDLDVSPGKSNHRGTAVSDFLLHTDFLILNDDSCTYYNDSTGASSRLDLAIGNLALQNLSPSFSLGVDIGSDHSPIIITLQIDAPSRIKSEKVAYDFKNANWEEFRETLDSLLPDSLTLKNPAHLDNAANIIAEAVFIAQECSIPKITHHFGRSHPISPFTLRKIQERRRLRRKLHRRNSPELRLTIRALNKEIKTLLAQDSDRYWDEYCSNLDHETDPKEFWKLFKRVSRPPSTNPKPLRLGPQTIFTNEGKAEIFGETLAAAMTEPPSLLDSLSSEADYSLQKDIISFSPDRLFQMPDTTNIWCPIELDEIINTLKLLPNKAPGIDKVFFSSLKHGSEKLLDRLYDTYNASITLAYVPSPWKSAVITMIPKPGKDPADPSSYRPISLLSCIGKLLEKIMTARITSYLVDNQLLNPTQAGFRHDHSTIEQLTRLSHSALHSVHLGKHFLALFFDVTKAFDKVWHQGLLYKLHHHFRLPVPTLKWIKSYLTHRTFQVSVQNCLSGTYAITAGVPQGSVLAPLLFLAYVNDLSSHIPAPAYVSQYADDTAIWIARKEEVKLEEEAQSALDALSSYCKNWRISMNPSKSSCLHIPRGLPHDPYNFRLWMNGDIIPSTPTCKFLGVTFHKNLRWSPHVEAIRQKAIRKLNCLKILARTNGCAPRTIIHLYLFYIRPILTYGFEAWANVPDPILDRLARIERAAIKFAYRIPRYFPSEYIYRVSAITPLAVYASDLALRYYQKPNCPEDIQQYLIRFNKNHKGHKHSFRSEYPIFSAHRRLQTVTPHIHTEPTDDTEQTSTIPAPHPTSF